MAIFRQGAFKKWDKKNSFFQKRTGEVIENKWLCVKIGQKRTENEPKNEAEKLLKTRDCIKNEPKTNRNEPKNEPGHVVENTGQQKNEPEICLDLATLFCSHAEVPKSIREHGAFASASLI
jgi:hypothetical protein